MCCAGTLCLLNIAWYAMPTLFSASVTLSSRVMSSTNSPNRLVFAQTQELKKVIESIIVVDLDDEEKLKIVKLSDQDGKLPTWFGSHFLRRANAKAVGTCSEEVILCSCQLW
ncbi:hypothetical protein BDZ89DRAFT_587970 [Hymenopellis radicata]|nr:hypothetical protein BDZ89DRAFT_587970 [Hymenopellis radicata]